MLLVFMIFIKELTVLSERKTIISVFKLLFLADSGGEEQGDGLSFSFSIINYKSLTYAGGSRPITVFCLDKHSFCSQSDERQPLILR